MKTKKILFSFAIACFVLIGCISEAKKEVLPVNKQNVSLAISGMTCEIGCAKTIQSKLSKKEGVLNAKVIFKDSVANIEFDANTTSQKDLIAFVDGIAGGELYKASLSSTKGKHTCSDTCKEKCENKTTSGKECKQKCDSKDSTKACCTTNKDKKMTCKENCKKACCADKKAA
ncbi:heavy metal-associated domain-containing protein [Polaribacter staleyi]|uniref:heavy metal-associated domain-containing protein n=1 Tax=Polaribacter staleyi TaxID=2022337 RepID=UPI0031B9DBC5